jgi:hypothetical protein
MTQQESGNNLQSSAGEHHEPQKDKWTRADRISLGVAIIAVLSSISPWVPSVVRHFTQPEVVITAPSANFVTTSKGFSVTGTAQHIPDDNDLWLIIRAPDYFWYPVDQLDTVNGQWSVAAHKICFLLGPGTQDIQVWMVPDTSDGPLVTWFSRSGAPGLTNLPPESVREADTLVQVPSSARVNC